MPPSGLVELDRTRSQASEAGFPNRACSSGSSVPRLAYSSAQWRASAWGRFEGSAARRQRPGERLDRTDASGPVTDPGSTVVGVTRNGLPRALPVLAPDSRATFDDFAVHVVKNRHGFEAAEASASKPDANGIRWDDAIMRELQ
jgi:hypothetical protein